MAKKNFLPVLLFLLVFVVFACVCIDSVDAAVKPRDLRLERSAVYFGENHDVIVNVELSKEEYVYLFLETPGGMFLDYRGEEFRTPVIFGVFGPGSSVKCRIEPDLFGAADTGVYNIYAVQDKDRYKEPAELGIESWEDLYDLSLQATLDVVGPYSASASILTLERQGMDAQRSAELSIVFQADGIGRMRGVPPFDTDGVQRLYINSSRSSETAYLEARAWDNGWVNVKAEVSGSKLRSGVNIFDLVWEDSRGRVYDTIYTFDDGCIYLKLTTDSPGEVVFRAARDSRMSSLLRNGRQTIDFLKYNLEELYLGTGRYEARAGERFKLTASLWSSKLNVEGIEVAFQERREGGSWRTIARADSDRYGKVEREISKDIAGKYEYRVEALGRVSNVVEKVIVAGAPYEVKPEAARRSAITGRYQKIRINYLDRYGNVIDKTTLDYMNQKPEDVAELVLIAPDRRRINTAGLLRADKDGIYLYYHFPEEGIYQLEAFIAGTGISSTCEIHSKIFGKESKLVLEADRVHIRSRERSLTEVRALLDKLDKVDHRKELQEVTKLTATLVDDQDNEIILNADDVTFALTNHNMASIYQVGDEAWLVAESGASGEVEVLAFHKGTDLTDRLTISISGEPWYLDADVMVSGNRATVKLTYLDKNGRPAAVLDKDKTGYEVLAPPRLSLVLQENFEVGSAEATFVVESLTKEAYDVHVITETEIPVTVKIDFAKALAQEVKMYIGETRYLVDGKEATMDMAPFIQSERTFVPVRFIAQAFGVEESDIKWEPKEGPVEEVFIPYKNKIVTITIGSETIRVLDKGELKQVKSDVAAFIRDGRTVLPLRAIGEIFGAEFDWGPKTGGTEWVSFKL
ncbi:MAG: copper amine oxidase N-terminal domain-containing protein [Firmicutes bacterium]|nr:copper amine oxidase N-terminal domain-containing protein [Bacillota bacterium]